MSRTPRSFSAYDHFLALCFAQLTFRQSVRDVITVLNTRVGLQMRLGFRGRLTRTNLAYSNEHRDWRIFEAAAQILMRRASRLYQDTPEEMELPSRAFALDSSIVSLSVKLFPWAHYHRTKGAAMKLHSLIQIRGSLPAWATLTEATFPDMKALDMLPIETGAFYVMDRGYLDFRRLRRLQDNQAYFVVRNKHHVRLRPTEARKVDRSTGLRCDQTVRLIVPGSRKVYPHALRRVSFRDEVHKNTLVFLTNNFEVSALTVSHLYKRRWEVELFFKWIKQHLRLRHFFGHSENAIQCQVWSAICCYLLVAIARKQLNLNQSLYQILQVLSVSAFEQIPLYQLFANDMPPVTTLKPLETPLLGGF